jgi:AraC-like DNA-binding protein
MLKIKLHHGDSFLKDLLDQHAQNILKQREHVFSLPGEVRQLVSAMMIDGVPTKDSVAEQLGLSGRSLHRKLQELGTGYREILDQVRLEIAVNKLKEDSESGSKIAEYLGFSSHQAFWRWYKQMTGKTPGEHRKEMTGKHA